MSKTMERIRKTKEALDGATEPFQPKYRIISESLMQAILSNEYPEGSRLPSENELVRRFGVSRMTIGKALKELEQDGTKFKRSLRPVNTRVRPH
jgi:DNA-binding GntR family transcriptional regulator